MAPQNRLLAIVTGASTGIGYELARQCAEHGFNLLIAADEPEIHKAAENLRALGAAVEPVEAELSTQDGVVKLYQAAQGRKVDARDGFEAMMNGEGDVASGWKNKIPTRARPYRLGGNARPAAPQNGRTGHGREGQTLTI